MADPISLLELNKKIQNVINQTFEEPIWIIAEISELRENNSSGHCYLELVEKNNKSNKIVAKSRATIWAFTYRMLKPYFESTTGRAFCEDLKVMIKVLVEFHEIYAFSLNVLDIDPTYTIGDLALKKQEIINQLTDEGVINMNKELDFPEVPQKIAIISSETAAGFGDFLKQLNKNEFGYRFYTQLFPAIMQGNKAEESIIAALDKIYTYEDFFDVVVIIRGGGSKIDLSCFDSYWLSYHIAQFPLPVITGIGHERDDTIADLVANNKQKTPTAVAAYLISALHAFENHLYDLFESFMEATNENIYNEKQWLNSVTLNSQRIIQIHLSDNFQQIKLFQHRCQTNSNFYFVRNNNKLSRVSQKLNTSVLRNKFENIHKILAFKAKLIQQLTQYFDNSNNQLNLYENTAYLSNPFHLLKKGYSITYSNNRVVKSIDDITVKSKITTMVKDGKVESIVNKTMPHPKK